MNLRSLRPVDTAATEAAGEYGRCISLLAEGAAINALEIDSQSYADFRGTIQKLTLQVPDHTPLPEKLAIVQAIVQEFENYRKRAGDPAVAGANLGSGI